MNTTDIDYVDFSWNPIAMHCTPVSPGCDNCWHLRMAKRLASNPTLSPEIRMAHDRKGNFVLVDSRLNTPLRRKTPSRIAVQFMGDLFHESVDFDMIDDIFAVMGLCPQHTFLVLTKRPERMAEYSRYAVEFDNLEEAMARRVGWTAAHPFPTEGDWPLTNVWLGVTVENQEQADKRIPILFQVPATVRFASVEPMLSRVDLMSFRTVWEKPGAHIRTWTQELNWTICGGETGPGARPIHPDWVRSLRDQCQEAGVPFFFKSWGGPHRQGWVIDGQLYSGRLLDGREWNEYPGDSDAIRPT